VNESQIDHLQASANRENLAKIGSVHFEILAQGTLLW